ncbi:ABC transporter permease [Methylotetracoccus oryzae]|uniref:ABC transporter permease n=1 Tax=Methylotetracoccus oryzae TaxID=1919059 RepID=UPI00111B424E|nr:ABC transporter permease [Methylotetracoccus oryzae]
MSWPSPRIRAQIVKELLSVWRDPKSRFLLIGPPIFQLLIFSFAATLELRNVAVGVCNRDNGRWGHELVSRLGAAAFVRHLRPAHSAAEIRDMLDRRLVLAAIDIPETFSRDLVALRPASVQVILDGRRANSAQILLGYLNALVGGLNADRTSPPAGNDSRLPLEGAGGEWLPPAADRDGLAVRHWFNPNLIYRWFIVPSLGGVLVMFATLLVTALSIARERELGTFDQLLVSPCTPTEIVLTKLVPALLIGTVMGLVMAAAGVFGFGVPFTGSFPLLFCSLLLFIVSIVGIGLMISSICSTQQQAILGTFAMGVPAVLMSGFATPVENMPQLLQGIAQIIPLTHYLIILQGSFLKALPASEILAHAWPMAAIAAVTLSAATVFVRSKLQ